VLKVFVQWIVQNLVEQMSNGQAQKHNDGNPNWGVWIENIEFVKGNYNKKMT
jgi:hypothetical protein